VASHFMTVWLWKNIRKGWKTFSGFAKFEVENWAVTNFWHDLWCEDTVQKKAFPGYLVLLV